MHNANVLPDHELIQFDDIAVRKFERIMVRGWVIEIDLTEPSDPRSQFSLKQAFFAGFLLKSDFRTRTQTNRDRRCVR